MGLLTFKKPRYVLPKDGPLTRYHTDGVASSEYCSHAAIPPQLSFDNIICNKCSPPCSLQDFIDYMLYVEKRAENLQFYLWMVDYYQRFRNAPKALTDLSPPWPTLHSVPLLSNTGQGHDRDANMSVDTNIDKCSEDISSVSTWDCEQTEFSEDFTQTMNTLKFSIFPVKQAPANKKKSPGSGEGHTQPFRAEIDRIIKHYLVAGSPRQLNLSDSDRDSVTSALRHTTHPSALSVVKRVLDSTLRRESHPNFVRWSICNGTRPWTFAIRAFGIFNITMGFAIAIILTLSRYSRYWRIIASLEWWVGFTNIIAASQGLCILLHRLHTRQIHAWEHEDPSASKDDEAAVKGVAETEFTDYENTKSRWPVRLEVFGPTNDYNGEAWVELENRKPWYRKIFEKRTAVREAGLRNMQNRMILQAEVWALLITIPLTVGFVAIPKGRYF